MNAVIQIEELKARLRATWVSGDFGKIAESFEDGAAEFVQRLGLRPGTRVLDVACGSGNQSIPAARNGAVVTGIDIAPNLLAEASEWAASEELSIRFEEGDVETLPYENGMFDVVMSMFGAMFAPRPEFAAREMLRVCRPGGIVAMGNWTADGFVGQMFRIVGSHVPPPAGIPSPLLWGDEPKVRERFGDAVSDLRFNVRTIAFRFASDVPETIEQWIRYYGPTHKAYHALDDVGKVRFRRDLERLWADNNLATDGTTYVKSDYLEVIAVRD